MATAALQWSLAIQIFVPLGQLPDAVRLHDDELRFNDSGAAYSLKKVERFVGASDSSPRMASLGAAALAQGRLPGAVRERCSERQAPDPQQASRLQRHSCFATVAVGRVAAGRGLGRALDEAVIRGSQ